MKDLYFIFFLILTKMKKKRIFIQNLCKLKEKLVAGKTIQFLETNAKKYLNDTFI